MVYFVRFTGTRVTKDFTEYEVRSNTVKHFILVHGLFLWKPVGSLYVFPRSF